MYLVWPCPSLLEFPVLRDNGHVIQQEDSSEVADGLVGPPPVKTVFDI
jgi:hypothetical protein